MLILRNQHYLLSSHRIHFIISKEKTDNWIDINLMSNTLIVLPLSSMLIMLQKMQTNSNTSLTKSFMIYEVSSDNYQNYYFNKVFILYIIYGFIFNSKINFF